MPAETKRFGAAAARDELRRLAGWWLDNAPDNEYGGFLGEIDHDGRPRANANKHIILNSRLLWFFSELCRFEPHDGYREAADRAFRYLLAGFDDPEHGGAAWEIARDGVLVDGKKQTYALCFCIYAFVAYYRLCDSSVALTKALEYFDLIEEHARDRTLGGYVEAYSRNWGPIDDVRLGETDLNAPKTMNTHLHLLEAYTALHLAQPSERTAEALGHGIDLFSRRIVDAATGHLRLFFDMHWTDVSQSYSYGHDIEASWLLWEAVTALGDDDRIGTVRPLVLSLADSCLGEGVAADGRVCDEFDFEKQSRNENGVWWVQAEALVGFLNAAALSGESRYRRAADGVWRFLNDRHFDRAGGEWHWLVDADGAVDDAYYKAGPWKGPYHNGRAMMETVNLFSTLEKD